MHQSELNRCPWCGQAEDYQAYHDHVWGRPEYDSQVLFAKLCLDGQQAGLSWITILRKQKAYEEAFLQFDPHALHALQGEKRDTFIEEQMSNSGIVRNRLKIQSILKNAAGFIKIEQGGNDFGRWLWSFVGGKPLDSQPASMQDIPTQSAESEAMSRALKKAGFTFVGPTICYAFMQAVGMINDHLADCHVRDTMSR